MKNTAIKNRDFFYLQYNKINWKNQEKTKINSFIYNYIIKNIIPSNRSDRISIFDIGLGIGFFIKMLLSALGGQYKHVTIEGCDPSRVNYKYFLKKKPKEIRKNIILRTYRKTFQDVETRTKFDFITAIYVFPHFLLDDLEKVVRKIHSMLKESGKFILVTADEKYLKDKLKTEKDLSIETRKINYKGEKYSEILHYTDIPKIGKVIDYNREEKFYIDLFEKNKFALRKRKILDDNNFICALFVFEKR